MSSINKYKITFTVTSDWDENPGTAKVAEPITLGEVIEHGVRTQLNFKDGGTCQFEDLDFGKDTVDAEIKRD